MVLTSNSIVSKARSSARMLGDRILRGAALPNDKIIVYAVDPVDACTEPMAALAVVSPFTLCLYVIMLLFFYPLNNFKRSIFSFSGWSLGCFGGISRADPSS